MSLQPRQSERGDRESLDAALGLAREYACLLAELGRGNEADGVWHVIDAIASSTERGRKVEDGCVWCRLARFYSGLLFCRHCGWRADR